MIIFFDAKPKISSLCCKKPGPTVISIGDIWRDKNPHPFSLQNDDDDDDDDVPTPTT
jgi:hypothetical protein